MKSVLFGLAASLVVFSLLPVGRVSSQEKGNVYMEPRPVRQGDMVKFVVDLDKAPNVGGGVFIRIVPDGDPTKQLEFNVGTPAGAKRADVYGAIPLEAPIGIWKVKELSFHPENELVQPLAISGKLSFQVSKHEPLVLPSSATVRIEQ